MPKKKKITKDLRGEKQKNNTKNFINLNIEYTKQG